MEEKYKDIIDFIVDSGNRLLLRAGNVKDIGVMKINLTEEDLAIERGLKSLVSRFGRDQKVYAEEENNVFERSANLWVIDPISGTHRFIEGKSHYAIVLTHLVNHQPQFAVVYDPSVKELFTAYGQQGAYLNGKAIQVSDRTNRVIIRPSLAWKEPEVITKVLEFVKDKEVDKNFYSMAVNYCKVASGRADGVIAFTKDTFPEFAGQLIIKEAGGRFTNIDGGEKIQPRDRIFVGGNIQSYNELYPQVKKITGL